MRIGVPREPADQPRAAASPQTVERMTRLGYEVLVERGAGERAQFPDDAYVAAGAELAGGARVWGCEVVVSASAPSEEHLALMSRGAVLICRLDPARRPELLEALRERGITCLALDVVPRVSRAQSLDVLSSQANLAGYRAVIEAASHLGRLFSGQVTAAGKFPPATVYVIGAGVAGLSAIGTACSLGAQVRGSDVRPEVADQVRSMGAQFVPLPSAQEVSSDGYAKEMDADQAAAANALYARQAAESDVVLIIGANDTVNPAAKEPGSPIAGMPVPHVWEASRVIVFKRSMATGYAGVNNPLFFRENSSMLFGDAKDTVKAIIRALE